MKRVIIFSIFLITLHLNAQTTQENEVKATIDRFFEGFHKGDTLILKETLADNVLLQTAYRNQQGKDILNTDDVKKLINAIGTRPADQKWDERLLSYTIKVDGNMANAWTPYEFWFNGNFSHCGVNSFQLFNDGGKWKIIYLIDTRRRKGCNQ